MFNHGFGWFKKCSSWNVTKPVIAWGKKKCYENNNKDEDDYYILAILLFFRSDVETKLDRMPNLFIVLVVFYGLENNICLSIKW